MHSREIKSYVKRAGRITKRQAESLACHYINYGINDTKELFNFSDIFDNNNPVILEIGFGMGSSLAEMALANPHKNYLGVEVHEPGVGNIIYLAHKNKIDNLKVILGDATHVIQNNLMESSISTVQIFFPDPWHKKKHNKRRLIQQNFLDKLYPVLENGALIHFATDWNPYAIEVLDLFSRQSALNNQYDSYAPRPKWRPYTKFEERGKKLNHKVYDLLFNYCSDKRGEDVIFNI